MLTRFFLCLTCAFSVFSCTTPGDEKKKEVKLSPEEQARIAEYKAEVDLGRDMAGRLLGFYGTYGDPELAGYINQLGNYVASYGDAPERRYMFAVLDTDSVNAFAAPGGYILVTLGTVRNARNEAELAAVLGHEVAHVAKQHVFNTLKNMGKKKMEDAAKKAEKGEKLEPETVTVRRRPVAESDAAAARFTRYLSSQAGIGMTLLQAAKAGMNVLLEAGLDKKLEYEADAHGVKYATNAGYDPDAMVAFLKRLNKKKKKLNTAVLEKTHPKIIDRTKRIEDVLVALDASSIIGATGKKRFTRYLKTLPKAKKKS